MTLAADGCDVTRGWLSDDEGATQKEREVRQLDEEEVAAFVASSIPVGCGCCHGVG